MSRMRWVIAVMVVACLAFVAGATSADEAPPLPLHSIEGVGGVFCTSSAYLVNPGPEGEVFGLPSVGAAYVDLGHGRTIQALTFTETLWGRVELGYGWDHMSLGGLPGVIHFFVNEEAVDLHNFNVRVALVKEGDLIPALTAGVHYKRNLGVRDINNDLFGALGIIGVKDDDGLDFTLYASKTIESLPRPVIVNVGLRSTQAAHIGLLGFTDDREILAEGNVVVRATDRLALFGEYRMMPDGVDNTLSPLIKSEDDWWTTGVCYVAGNNLTITGGYGQMGDVLNNEANNVWALKCKWEF
ncbi:MAG: DUF3034 family protein [Planctomycetes bacterium]|nr:DUF3034 family protein [Planctomycetota bacterium]